MKKLIIEPLTITVYGDGLSPICKHVSISFAPIDQQFQLSCFVCKINYDITVIQRRYLTTFYRNKEKD
jgi:hypothetical protein